MALGNVYQSRIAVYECTETKTWTNDLHNNKTQYEEVLYFANTELSHLDLVVDSKQKRNPDLFTESSDSEIEITKVVPAGEPNNNNPAEINTKQGYVSEIQIAKIITRNEQNNNSLTKTDVKEENISENYTYGTRTLSETKPDVSRRASGKIYNSEHYWEEENPVFANNLPNDIDNKCVYVLPINKSKRFEFTKNGRPWSNTRESKRSNFSGDRYMSISNGSYECHNPQCPHSMQYKKINRRQFRPKGVCRSCCTLS